MPHRAFDNEARQGFKLRRDDLFDRCTVGEQQALHVLAAWHAKLDPRLVDGDGWLARCARYVAMHKAFGWTLTLQPERKVPPPGWLPRLAARVHAWVVPLEARRATAHAKRFIELLGSSDVTDPDSVLGAACFLLALPLDFGHSTRLLLDEALKKAASDGLSNGMLPAQQRFEVLQRVVQWPVVSLPTGGYAKLLELAVWRLLSQWAKEDLPAACEVVDQQHVGSNSSKLFRLFGLYDDPGLAIELAKQFGSSRTELASELLQRAIFGMYLRTVGAAEKGKAPSTDASDEACDLLASWLAEPQRLSGERRLGALQHLFQFGNPSSNYWATLPQVAMTLVRDWSDMPSDARIRLLAAACFYGSNEPAVFEQSRLQLLTELQGRFQRMESSSDSSAGDWGGDLQHLTMAIDSSVLDLLEGPTRSCRNVRVAAQPQHLLLADVQRLLDETLERLRVAEPGQVLIARVGVIRGLRSSALLLEQHRCLREEFEVCASASPRVAGEALMLLARHTAYSDSGDHVHELARMSLDVLLPVLERISPSDASVARTGLTWSARGNL